MVMTTLASGLVLGGNGGPNWGMIGWDRPGPGRDRELRWEEADDIHPIMVITWDLLWLPMIRSLLIGDPNSVPATYTYS